MPKSNKPTYSFEEGIELITKSDDIEELLLISEIIKNDGAKYLPHQVHAFTKFITNKAFEFELKYLNKKRHGKI